MQADLILDLQKNYSQLGAKYFCDKYNKSLSAIYTLASKYKCTAIHHLEANKNNIIDEYNSGVSIKDIKTKFGHDTNTIIKLLQRNGCKIRGPRESHLKYSLDEAIFEQINSHEKAYWLGFLYADGNVYQNKLQLRLGNKDIGHIENFRSFLKSDHTIYSDNKCHGIQIRCPKIILDLKKLGITPDKTLNIKFPNKKQVPDQFISSFILGYFDGDGCISIKSNNSTYLFSILGTEPFLRRVRTHLKRHCKDISININKESRNKNVFVLHFSGGVKRNKKSRNSFLNLYSFLFTNAPKCVLIRKRHKFELIYNHARTLTAF
jgi:hypothetical protein